MKNEANSEVLNSLRHNLYVITLTFFMSELGDPFHLKTLILFTSKPWDSVVLDPRVLLGSPWLYPIGYLRYPEAILACEPNGLCHLPPRLENQRGSRNKNPVGKKYRSGVITFVWVDSFRLLTTSVSVCKRVETSRYFSVFLFLIFY